MAASTTSVTGRRRMWTTMVRAVVVEVVLEAATVPLDE
jgi:hypothetical protein